MKHPDRTTNRPIALITDHLPRAIQWVLKEYGDEVIYYSTVERLISLRNGQNFVIVTKKEHLKDIEIADYRDVGGHGRSADWYIGMIALAQERMPHTK